ncbi:MAG: response regulator transcription factor [Phycisphaerales bacterium]|nr:MAG: response regulator transcription factor [Phycisphaerales bacterium]
MSQSTNRQPRCLSTREMEIYEDLLTGDPVKVIASRRFRSIKTVQNHILRIYSKLGYHSRAQLISDALKNGRPPGAMLSKETEQGGTP